MFSPSHKIVQPIHDLTVRLCFPFPPSLRAELPERHPGREPRACEGYRKCQHKALHKTVGEERCPEGFIRRHGHPPVCGTHFSAGGHYIALAPTGSASGQKKPRLMRPGWKRRVDVVVSAPVRTCPARPCGIGRPFAPEHPRRPTRAHGRTRPYNPRGRILRKTKAREEQETRRKEAMRTGRRLPAAVVIVCSLTCAAAAGRSQPVCILPSEMIRWGSATPESPRGCVRNRG